MRVRVSRGEAGLSRPEARGWAGLTAWWPAGPRPSREGFFSFSVFCLLSFYILFIFFYCFLLFLWTNLVLLPQSEFLI